MTPPPPPRLGRPREFDPEEALEQALEAFWTHGYEGTSMALLVEATGVQKGSLYQAFGDKHQLFVRALKRYLDRGLSDVHTALEDPDAPAQALRRWLEWVGRSCSDPSQARGCFAINTLTEVAQHDPEVAELLDDHFTRLRSLFDRVISRAQSLGQLSGHAEPSDLASFLLVVLAGMRANAKTTMEPGHAARLVDIALGALER